MTKNSQQERKEKDGSEHGVGVGLEIDDGEFEGVAEPRGDVVDDLRVEGLHETWVVADEGVDAGHGRER